MRRRFLVAPLLLLLDPLADHVANAFSQGCWSQSRVNPARDMACRATFFKTSASSPWSGLNSQRSASSLSMVVEKMSDECVGAVMTSHNIGNQLGLSLLQNEILFAGIVGKPERAQSTLEKYGITYEAAKDSAVAQLKQSGVGLIISDSSENEDKQIQALPFSKESKQVLTAAMKIAKHFNSETIRSEHVLLALCGYNFGGRIVSAPAYNVLMNTEGLTGLDKKGGKYPIYTFCEFLVSELEKEPNEDIENPQGATPVVEEVKIGGANAPVSNTLAEVGVDLTQMALEGNLDVVFGRDTEIRTALRTLGRRRKNNPCLIGDPGVGKTAVAEAIAQVLASGLEEIEGEEKFKLPTISNPFRRDKPDEAMDKANGGAEETDPWEYKLPPCPKSLMGFRLVSIELASLVAGTRNRGDFEEKIQKLIKEASNTNVILFIDEIHNLIGTGGGGDGAMNAANLLKPALARGELRVLGATTTPEYRRYIEKDGALERRFQPLEIKEPTVEETLDILSAIVPRYEEYHGVEYTSNALVAAAKLSDRYISDRFLPDKAIDLLDEAGSMVNMNEDEDLAGDCFVTEDSVTAVISELTGIPIGRLDTGEKERLRNLEVNMGKRIKGQANAVTSVAKSIRRARSGMRDGKRPVASFLFCGPTGVGKTELCKALAETYYGQEKDVIRIDMSEYMDRVSTSRLVGAPPGYVGYEEGGQLTDAVRRAPHSVVLFDEVEKAHEDVLNLLLQVMDEGTLTDGKGRTVSFKNTIFVMTSNVGSQRILELSRKPDDVVDDKDKPQTTEDAVKEELEKAMKPELLNRIDEIVTFSPLSYDNLRDIASNLLTDSASRASDDQDIRIQVADNLVEMVTREGLANSAQFGARPIRRAVQRYLEDTMAEAIMQEFVNEGDQVVVDLAPGQKDEKIMVKITRVAAESGDKSSITVQVENDAGIGSSRSRLEWQALYGPAPSLDDDESPERDAEGFQ